MVSLSIKLPNGCWENGEKIRDLHFSAALCRLLLITNRKLYTGSRKAAYEIFIIERRFQWSKFRFSRFKKTCARGHQRAVKVGYFTVVGQSFVKTVADEHGHASYHNKKQ